MNPGIKRFILRLFHILLGIPIIGYIYSPIENLHDYAFPTRFIFLPLLVLSGLWMWKGHWIKKLFGKKKPAA